MTVYREVALNNSKLTPIDLYVKLESYYNGNGIYDSIKEAAYYSSYWLEAMKPLRNVVNRSVEFYVAKVLPDVTVVASKPQVKIALDQFMKWSNFSGKKPLYLRTFSLKGDLFLKVTSSNGKVFSENIKPEDVTDFTEDSRGYITTIRIDKEIILENGLTGYYTEYWDKTALIPYYAIWTHPIKETPLANLGTPDKSEAITELGIDFIPIVHTKFKDIGKVRGQGCVTHCLDKIDEANREATALAQTLFRYNKPKWTITSPEAAPEITTKSTGKTSDNLFTENSILMLPDGAQLNSLVPNINYAAALDILKDMVNELQQDLPELKYYSLSDQSLSGKAISLLLAGAIDRANEARANFVQGIIKLNEMALTYGKNLGIFPQEVGTYEKGDFAHEILVSNPWETDSTEKAALFSTLSAKLPVKLAMKIAGYSEKIIDELPDNVGEGNGY